MAKTPDEIKKALECCFNVTEQCGECPYYPVSCDKELVRDARVYIRQLEMEREELIAGVINVGGLCSLCKHGMKRASQEPCNNCRALRDVKDSFFEWRGVQKEE